MGTGSADRRPRVRVDITGIGLVTSLGPDRESTWAGLIAGASGARLLDGSALGGHGPWVGYPVLRGGARPGLASLLESAAQEAWDDAGLGPGRFDPDRAATLVGLSKPGTPALEGLKGLGVDRGADPPPAGPDAAALAALLEALGPGSGARAVARRFGLRGPCSAPVAACATGLVAALQGAWWIARGVCDVAVVGAADASLEPLWLAAFRRMRALAEAPEGSDPLESLRPLDRRRSGFLVGEGAAVLVLERGSHAEARGIRPYATLAGGALGADAYHLTDLNPDPGPLADLIGRALASAGLAPGDLDHVNLHGTGTRPNDPLECQALRRALGSHAGSIAATASKAQLGHLLGAAGAVELAVACLSLRDGCVPPTRHLTDPDPACDLDATPLLARSRPIGAALKLSLGFGGHLAAAVLTQPEGPRRRSLGGVSPGDRGVAGPPGAGLS